jgi:hypothetical protein
MPTQSFKGPVTIHSAKAADGVGTAADVAGFRHLVVQASAALNSSLTFKIQGSVSEAAPDFSTAQSATNHWDFVASYDLQDAALVAGDTGVVLNNDTVANNTRQYLVNADHLRWVNVQVSSYVDGSLTCSVAGTNL